MHVEGVVVSFPDVVNGVLALCLRVDWQLAILKVEMHWNWCTMDVIWLPPEDHVRPERILRSYACQLHWRHRLKHLPFTHFDVLIFLA